MKTTTPALELPAALWELAFPQRDRITWVEQRALKRHHATQSRLATPAQDGELLSTIRRIYADDGFPEPKVILFESKHATAMHLENNTLAISTTKIATMPPAALEASIAHEMTHQKQLPLLWLFRILAGVTNLAGTYTALRSATVLTRNFTSQALAQLTNFGIGMGASMFIDELLNIPFKAFRRWQESDADRNAARITSPQQVLQMLEIQQERQEARAAHSSPHEKTWIEQLNREHPETQSRIDQIRQKTHVSSMEIS
jgi:Zn-dependent protease with chaperone function